MTSLLVEGDTDWSDDGEIGSQPGNAVGCPRAVGSVFAGADLAGCAAGVRASLWPRREACPHLGMAQAQM